MKLSEEQFNKIPRGQDFSEWIRGLIDHSDLFREAFKELNSIFEKFSESPTTENAIQLFSNANLKLIDEAREKLK
jgi:hypothetical protein